MFIYMLIYLFIYLFIYLLFVYFVFCRHNVATNSAKKLNNIQWFVASELSQTS